MFSKISFAGIVSVYVDFDLRQSSYKSDTYTFPILANINHYQLAKAGFFCLGCIFVQCFCCEKKIKPDNDMSLGDLKDKCHKENCDYIANITHDDLCEIEEISVRRDDSELCGDKEGAVYPNALQRLYMTSNAIDPKQKHMWRTVHNRLKINDCYGLGLFFDMQDDGPSFPIIRRDLGYGYNLCDAQSLKAVFFQCDSFLALSLMLEMDRKLALEVEGMDYASRAELLCGFEDMLLLHSRFKSGAQRGFSKKLKDVISKTGELFDGVDVAGTDIGALLVVAPRFVLLNNETSLAELSNLVYNLSKMFYDNSLVNKIYHRLKVKSDEGWRYAKWDYISLMPTYKEMAFLMSQHISTMSLWSLLAKIKHNVSIPEFVDPNNIEQYSSVENMKSIILEAGMSVFKDRKKLKLRLQSTAINKEVDYKKMITKEKIEECFERFKENLSNYELSRLTDKDFFQKLFSGGKFRSLCVQAGKELVEDVRCHICTETLEEGKTKIIGFTSCNHFFDETCWGNCFQFGGARCPLCRKKFKDPFAYLHSGKGAEIQHLNETVKWPVCDGKENASMLEDLGNSDFDFDYDCTHRCMNQ
ncbi:MAG: hypothetical protein QS748_11270 [Candidatus Endonucleobacter bathymodioli]|uniref:RING-type domain-containing protein n=1 Tax=Candidatus Endonucleibacter bathymodioli TaxID=539814 RepID=A0AA90SN82_9GAMM|nr:hypothetical protein [Candidatus Endonucleobacter bathymodioli]